MMQSSLKRIIGLVILGVILLANSLFTVSQIEKVIVFQFGEVIKVHDTPGLKFKVPFIQNTLSFDRRLLDYNLPVLEVTAEDQKRLVIDLYARFVISDVVLFYKKVTNIAGAQNRLATIVSSSMRQVIGRVPLSLLLSPDRVKIMQQIHHEVKESAKNLGIEVKDVRIIRTDLPKENSEAVFNRMQTERIQEAKQYRAEGKESALGIRAQAERERTILLAEAKKKAEILRGQGDAESAKIYANAFSKDQDFFAFYRSMEAYQQALNADDTTIILSPTNEFFNYFGLKTK